MIHDLSNMQISSKEERIRLI